MHRLEDADYRELASVLRERVASYAPDWTDPNDHDPGATLLELFAFLTESLLARGDMITERRRLGAARLAGFALALAGGGGKVPGCALARNRYYPGQLLTAENLQLEQEYFRSRLRRHNRELHGTGIVRGLKVSIRSNVSGPAQQVVVQPGLAIAPDGDEVEVCFEAAVNLPATGNPQFVMLSRAERLTRPIAVAGDEQVQFSRVEEGFALHLEAKPNDKGIILARLTRNKSGWKVHNARRKILTQPKI